MLVVPSLQLSFCQFFFLFDLFSLLSFSCCSFILFSSFSRKIANPCVLVRTLDPITLVVVALFRAGGRDTYYTRYFEIESETDIGDINSKVLAKLTEEDTAG